MRGAGDNSLTTNYGYNIKFIAKSTSIIRIIAATRSTEGTHEILPAIEMALVKVESLLASSDSLRAHGLVSSLTRNNSQITDD